MKLLFIILAIFQLGSSPLVDDLEGEYTDGTNRTIKLVIKRVSANEISISDPEGLFIKETLLVGILEKKEVDLVGIKSTSYLTSNKDVKFSEMNGEVTLSFFTESQAFVGKKKVTKTKPLLGKME